MFPKNDVTKISSSRFGGETPKVIKIESSHDLDSSVLRQYPEKVVSKLRSCRITNEMSHNILHLISHRSILYRLVVMPIKVIVRSRTEEFRAINEASAR